jgi:hypothetical protein
MGKRSCASTRGHARMGREHDGQRGRAQGFALGVSTDTIKHIIAGTLGLGLGLPRLPNAI